MKLMATLFALLFLGLTVMPCADNDQESGDQVEFHQSDGDHNHDETTDSCSPLCVCNCYHTNITIPIFLSFIPEIQLAQKFTSFYIDQQSNTYLSIWQPPKIS